VGWTNEEVMAVARRKDAKIAEAWAEIARLRAALAAAEARCARLEPYEWRCLAAEQKVKDLAADLHAAERAHQEAEAALAAAEARCARLEGALREALGWVPPPERCYWPENAETIRRTRAALADAPPVEPG
jgi:outer membrane protein TolC